MLKKKMRQGPTLRSEINVTPFVDVMLVLLVIFMAISPSVNHEISLNLPKGGKAQRGKKTASFCVSLTRQGELYLNGKASTLFSMIQALKKSSQPPTIQIRCDASVTYGQAITIFDALKKAGFSHVTLVTAP